jgi:Mu-like prophage protein gp29
MQQRPDLSRFREIPAFAMWRQRDKLEQVAQTLIEHDYGRFYESATLVDEMLTDDRIAGVLNTRIGGFLAQPTTFRPGNAKRKAAKLAQLLGGDDESQDEGIWPEICSQDTARELLKWRIMLGVAVAEIVWETTEESWTPRIIPVHPRYVRWDWMTQRFVIYMWQPQTIINLPETQHGPASDGKWIVWGGLRSWVNGAVRSLGTKYLGRVWNERDWFRYNEKHGLPAAKGKVPSEANAEEKAQFKHDLNNLGSEPTIICPQPQQNDQPGFDFEWVETTGTSTGGQTFQSLKTAMDADIAILLLGQNLTTEMGAAGGSASGSRAGAQVHELIRIDKKREDAELYRIVRQQCLTHWARFNTGDEELAPYPTAQIDPPDDELQEAQTLQALGAASQALKTANPRTDLDSIWEAYSIPMLDPGDPNAQPPPATEGPDAAGFHAFGAQGQHISGPHPTKEAAKAAGEKAGGGAPVVIKQKAAAEPSAQLSATNLVELKATAPAGRRRARYNDALTRTAAKRAAVALGPLVERIHGMIQTATGPDDLKRRLIAMYRAAPARELAKVFERTNILANLAGRHDLILEL